ncbi:oxalate:formate antiporter [Alkalihalophilus pseudofirmus OF4]|uniref:Oxalate:formate antiporter n=3 Tax=Alkalihalophilus TaxID=2893060 RepID=D3FXU0_ALKPO|nr:MULTISPECIES: OFA family MFS transporter [Alkalihalophilus]ADC48927.1 oxalate:formate antiporter [Alkalihalophilus pseudofirmus OF4]ERN52417.1 MFS transporter [Alkalihalophilus marmarensis DSM 21297]MDV2886059.1 OFA family MFS transporter [Alkalihalophilus pseudofirmus]MED1600141.1 OFA family MFS transporter [Alkalihalophilus marmarensis]OLS35362.1 MFS transporter [Alkalihalophilus pseudofirmus]
MNTTKNRWLIALSAIAIHLSIGGAYAYSVYTYPISEQMGWSPTEITIAFTIMMALAGTSAAFFGKFVERSGPRKSAIVAAVLFGLGQAGSGVAIALGSLPLFLLTYGLASGLGLGIGYISPVSTLVKWFPDRRGLATGMAVLGFGSGALITAPIAANLMSTIGISATFYVLGACYFALMLVGASYIAPPKEGWMPASMKRNIASGKKVIKKDLQQLTSNEAVKTKRFWMLWTMMLINTTAGIMMISVASPMAQEVVGLSAAAAATLVGIMGIFNGGGRLGWAAISDYIGRSNVFLIFFVIQTIAFLTLPMITNVIIFQLLILLVVSCYGGGFSNLPAFVGDLFGTKQLGAIHGYLLTTWSLGGILGPMIVSQIRERTDSYIPVFYVFSALILLALLVSIMMKLDIKKSEQETKQRQEQVVS